MSKPGEIHATISKLLEARLLPFISSSAGLNLATCVDIYTTIFEVLVEVVEQSQLPFSNEGLNFLAQQYYDAVKINGAQELDPEIFTQRAKVENIETKELALLAVVLSGTDFSLPVIDEIKRRS